MLFLHALLDEDFAVSFTKPFIGLRLFCSMFVGPDIENHRVAVTHSLDFPYLWLVIYVLVVQKQFVRRVNFCEREDANRMFLYAGIPLRCSMVVLLE